MYRGSNVVGIAETPVAVFVFDEGLVILKPRNFNAPKPSKRLAAFKDIDDTRHYFEPSAKRDSIEIFAQQAQLLQDYEITLILAAAITRIRYYKSGGFLSSKLLEVERSGAKSIVFSDYTREYSELVDLHQLCKKAFGQLCTKQEEG